MSEPQNPLPPEKKSYAWPLAINLGLLVIAALITGAEPNGMAIAVIVLVVINSIAAGIMAISGRIHYVLAFVLSALVIGLIGFGACALMLSNRGSMH